MMAKNSIKEALQKIHQQIIAAAAEYERSASEIQLLAVTKSRSVDDILAAYEAGQRCFAESYVQEALLKMNQLPQSDIEWHFIGKIQGNKTEDIAQHFDWVHTVDSVKHALQLNQYRPLALAPLSVCIQVNIDQEATKGGIRPEALIDLAEQVLKLPRLQLRGLMSIPKPTPFLQEQQKAAKGLKILFELLNRRGFALDTLSMGMSDDYRAAIGEGATIIRIGRAIFGK